MTQVIEILITDVVDVYHLTRTGNKETYPVSPDITALNSQIVPASEDILAVYPGVPAYRLYEVFLFVNDEIKNGDKIKSTTTGDYIVRGISFNVDNQYMTYQRIVGEKVVGT